MTSYPNQFVRMNTMFRITRHCYCPDLKSSLRHYSRELKSAPLMTEPVTEFNQHHVLEDIITPLARTPYNDQLRIKSGLVEQCIKDLRKELPNWRKSVKIDPIAPSPVTDQYRNKDEFNVRMGIDGDEKTFGFFTGKLDGGEVYAVRPTHLKNVRQEHKNILKVFEDFVKQSSLRPCYCLNDGGYWRQLLIRSNQKGDTMAVAVVRQQNRSLEEVEEEKRQLAEHFINSGVHLHSLYHQSGAHVRCTKENSSLSLIHGAPYIYESLLGHEFRISPDSFFQVNLKAAEVLHEEVFRLAEFNSSATLLDLCCGVGTFGISYHKNFKNCIGIERSESSLNDALANCGLNNVKNCEFSFGSVETRLTAVFDFLNSVGNLIVIANPGRSGLHPRAIQLLLENRMINKLIYVSCRPTNPSTLKNFTQLLDSRGKTKPFNLSVVKPVDMFPHTYHYELILVFQR